MLCDEEVAYCYELAENIAYCRSHNESICVYMFIRTLTDYLKRLVDCGTITDDDFNELLPWFLFNGDVVLD